ncbi:hypothetical protein V2S85_07700, partial [Novosphingobium resinovorum]|nr:hypothetical protein [Novosphingobium resinovorum]
AKSTPGMMEIGPNDALGAPRSLDVIKPARFARNYPVFAGLQLRLMKGAEGFCAAWDKAVDRGMLRLQDCALERAILGEERPVASQGKIVATYTRHDTALMLFLLRQRMPERYAAPPTQDARPGSALYERVRRDIEAQMPTVAETRAVIDAKLEQLRRTIKARRTREEDG